MRRTAVGIVLVASALAGVSCTSPEPELTNRFGDCNFQPGTDCHGQNLAAVSIPATDLTGANLSGVSLEDADLRNVIFRNANLSTANLSGADLTGADLRGANLSDAVLFRATMDRVDWSGANRSGTKFCNTLLPDGSVSDCRAIDDLTAPVVEVKPAVVVTFKPHRPIECFNDGAGMGIEVDWKVRNATSVVFLIDDLQASIGLGTRGIKRLPFPCDGERHRVTIQAFGAVPPLVTSSFTVAVELKGP